MALHADGGAPLEVRSPASTAVAAGSRAPGRSVELSSARASFLNGDPVAPGVVRRPILTSWGRSRVWRVRPDHLELPQEPGVDGDTPLVRAGEPVLADLADLFATEPVSLILCDADGVVLSRRTGDSGLEDHLDRVWLTPGFSYAEQFVGTNGIGTALEMRGPAHVFGDEHYVDLLGDLACAGVPIRHPVSGRLLGVVDLTCWRRDAGPLLLATATSLGRRIEEALLGQIGARERAVLDDYLVACHRSHGAVLALSDDLLMMNDRAREALEPGDVRPLTEQAREVLAVGERQTLLIDLPSGHVARVLSRPTTGRRGDASGVLEVTLVGARPAATLRALVPSPRGHAAIAVGSSAVWTKATRAVDRALQAGEWVVVSGERGSGRRTLVRAAHNGRTPVAKVRCLAAADHGPDWMGSLAAELAAGAGTVVISEVERLPAPALAQLAEILEPYQEAAGAERPWVAVTVTCTRGAPEPDLGPLLASFPCTVDVPPLRHHVEDLPELVEHLLHRLGHATHLTCSREALRVLMRNRWPGNTAQLLSVLRKVVGRRRAGAIQPADLPAECWVTARRVLGALESMECDAIVQALLDTGGNKVEAARRLSMSRATIYRKIREYGIAVGDYASVPAGAVPPVDRGSNRETP